MSSKSKKGKKDRQKALHQLTKAQRDEFWASFKVFDVDHDHHISVKELGEVMKGLGVTMSDKELKQMVKEVDADKSGTISFDEFCALMAPRYADEEAKNEELWEAFKAFDTDGDELLNPDEIRKAFEKLGEPLTADQVKQLVREVDSDNDMKCNFDEFKKMISD